MPRGDVFPLKTRGSKRENRILFVASSSIVPTPFSCRSSGIRRYDPRKKNHRGVTARWCHRSFHGKTPCFLCRPGRGPFVFHLRCRCRGFPYPINSALPKYRPGDSHAHLVTYNRIFPPRRAHTRPSRVSPTWTESVPCALMANVEAFS